MIASDIPSFLQDIVAVGEINRGRISAHGRCQQSATALIAVLTVPLMNTQNHQVLCGKHVVNCGLFTFELDHTAQRSSLSNKHIKRVRIELSAPQLKYIGARRIE